MRDIKSNVPKNTGTSKLYIQAYKKFTDYSATKLEL